MKRGMRWLVTVVMVLVGVVFLAAAVFWGLSSPVFADVCRPGYEACLGSGSGLANVVDCRIELLHCRAEGPEHWSAGDAR